MTTIRNEWQFEKDTSAEVATAFRARLVSLRQGQVASREAISELCGLHSDAIRRYEKGEAKPDMVSLAKLADFFNVSVDYLLGRSDNKNPLG